MDHLDQELYSTPVQSKSGSACHMTRSANHLLTMLCHIRPSDTQSPTELFNISVDDPEGGSGNHDPPFPTLYGPTLINITKILAFDTPNLLVPQWGTILVNLECHFPIILAQMTQSLIDTHHPPSIAPPFPNSRYAPAAAKMIYTYPPFLVAQLGLEGVCLSSLALILLQQTSHQRAKHQPEQMYN